MSSGDAPSANSAASMPSTDIKPVHIGIIAAVTVFVLFLVCTGSFLYRRSRSHRASSSASSSSRHQHDGLPTTTSTNGEMEQRDPPTALYYEDWLRAVMQQQQQQQQQQSQPSQRRGRTRARHGLRLVSSKKATTPPTAAQQHQHPHQHQPALRSPKFRLAPATTPESRQPLRASVASSAGWRSSEAGTLAGSYVVGGDKGVNVEVDEIALERASVGLGVGLELELGFGVPLAESVGHDLARRPVDAVDGMPESCQDCFLPGNRI